MVFSWLDAETSALTAIVLSGSTAYDDEGAIGTNDTTSAILKITRKAISEMRVLFFTETTSNRRKMLHQTCAIVWMEVYRIAPWFGLRLAGAFAKEWDAVFVRLTRRYRPMLTGWDLVANRLFFVTPSRARRQRAFYLPPMPSNSEKSSSREWMSSLRYRFRTCVFTVCSG